MSEPKVSVMLFPFHAALHDGTLTPDRLVSELSRCGVTGLEPMPALGQEQAAWWEELYCTARDSGMQCACADICLNLLADTEAKRRDALDSVAWGVEWCVQHNCRLALLAGSMPPADMGYERGREILADLLAQACDAAEGSGVTLTIEDYGMDPKFTCSAAHVLEVVESSGRADLKITFDNGNFMFAEELPVDCFPLLKDRIAHVHLKDLVPVHADAHAGLKSLRGRRYRGSAIGEGNAQVAECVQLLRDSGYEGWLSLEVSATPPLDETIRATRLVQESW